MVASLRDVVFASLKRSPLRGSAIFWVAPRNVPWRALFLHLETYLGARLFLHLETYLGWTRAFVLFFLHPEIEKLTKPFKTKKMADLIIPGLVSCYTDGDNYYYYFKSGNEIRELSTMNNIVRILSIDDYNDLVLLSQQ